jgi:hypothetical protein
VVTVRLFSQRPPVAPVAASSHGKVPIPSILNGLVWLFKHEMKMFSVFPTPTAYSVFMGLRNLVEVELMQKYRESLWYKIWYSKSIPYEPKRRSRRSVRASTWGERTPEG